jgi:hypothetical protein
MPDKFNIRHQLLELGVGDFNATMAIPYMLIAPRTSDPAMVQILVVVKKMQEVLRGMGARIETSGVLDEPTARVVQQICGPEWLSMPYYEIVRCVLNAKKSGHKFIDNPTVGGSPQATGDVFGFLPEIPGGAITYVAGAGLLYLWLKKRKRA